jgi:hypothetical protein
VSTEEEPRASLLSLGWVQALALALVSVVAFGTALGGALVWDDYAVIGPASALSGPLDAFSTNLFATVAGQGAKYYRPLVTLSYWVEVHLFASAPNVGMHASNLLSHTVVAVLLLACVRRVLAMSERESPARSGAAFGAVCVWAVMPIKAENVAWITGRGDVYGTAFLLAGLLLAARARGAPARAAWSGATTSLALLCKEAMVAAPAVFLGFAMCEVARAFPGLDLRTHVRRSLFRPEVLASLVVAVLFLVLRRLFFPVSTGDDELFSAFTIVDRVGLFLETSGLAVIATLLPWRPQLLRGPIGFLADGRLRHDLPAALAIGAGLWLAAGWLVWRKPAARGPLVLALGAFLPASNVVPIVLESRLSDRFLYLPSVGLAVGLAVALAALRSIQHRQLATAVALCCGVLLTVSARARAADFTSSERLFGAELKNGNRALAVYSNAAYAAAEGYRFREARDYHLLLARRYDELGYPGSSFGAVLAALRAQVWATEETHPPSMRSFEHVCRALLNGSTEHVKLEFEDQFVVELDIGNSITRAYVQKYGYEIRANLALTLARRGDPEAVRLTEENVEGCPRCSDVLVLAGEVALALGDAARASGWLEQARPGTSRREALRAAADAQRTLLAANTALARPLSLFVGGAFGPACAASSGLALAGSPAAARAALASACWLAPARREALSLVDGDSGRLATLGAAAEPLRADVAARTDLALSALAAPPSP